jgi:hypothetical protein
LFENESSLLVSELERRNVWLKIPSAEWRLIPRPLLKNQNIWGRPTTFARRAARKPSTRNPKDMQVQQITAILLTIIRKYLLPPPSPFGKDANGELFKKEK